MIYIAVPYTKLDECQREVVIAYARRYASYRCIEMKECVYCGPLMFHEAHKMFNLPHDYRAWAHQNNEMLRRSERFDLLAFRGWDASAGVQDELKMARDLGIRVNFVSVNMGGRRKKMCEDCADEAREQDEIAEASDSGGENASTSMPSTRNRMVSFVSLG